MFSACFDQAAEMRPQEDKESGMPKACPRFRLRSIKRTALLPK
jgi:hypothetical protein